MDLISEYADRVILLNDKKIVFDAPTKEVLTNKEIMQYGVNLPQVAKLGIEYEEAKGKQLDMIPATLEEAIDVFEKIV